MKSKYLPLTLLIICLSFGASAQLEFRTENPIDVFSQFDMNQNRITDLGSPQSSEDAVTKNYIDNKGIAQILSQGSDAGGNPIVNVGAGRIDLGDGAGDVDFNGQRLYNSNLTQTEFLGVTDGVTGAEAESNNMRDYSAYVQNDLKVGGDIIGSGGDLAENVKSEETIDEGSLVSIVGKFEVEKSKVKYDTSLAGVVSTDPGITLKKERDGVPLALSGIVPVKFSPENGPVEAGDLLTSSSTPGYAMNCEDRMRCSGSIVGKSMESKNEIGKIQTLVTLG